MNNAQHNYTKIKTKKLCEYGCGNIAQYKLNNNKLCCSQYYSQCPINRKKNGTGNKGKIRSEETKQKLRMSHTGKTLSEETKRKISQNHIYVSGKNHPMFGKKHSNEVKKKIGRANTGRIKSIKTRKKLSIAASGENNPMFGTSRCGSENPNWKGGLSNNPYCLIFLDKDFRKIIFERDGYTCLNPYCSKKSKRLTIHHIDYNKKNCIPINLICLCNSCNVKANKDRKWHEAWYTAIIYQRYINFERKF